MTAAAGRQVLTLAVASDEQNGHSSSSNRLAASVIASRQRNKQSTSKAWICLDGLSRCSVKTSQIRLAIISSQSMLIPDQPVLVLGPKTLDPLQSVHCYKNVRFCVTGMPFRVQTGAYSPGLAISLAAPPVATTTKAASAAVATEAAMEAVIVKIVIAVSK